MAQRYPVRLQRASPGTMKSLHGTMGWKASSHQDKKGSRHHHFLSRTGFHASNDQYPPIATFSVLEKGTVGGFMRVITHRA